MKRVFLSLFLAAAVIFALSGCKNNEDQNTAAQNAVSTAQQSNNKQQI